MSDQYPQDPYAKRPGDEPDPAQGAPSGQQPPAQSPYGQPQSPYGQQPPAQQSPAQQPPAQSPYGQQPSAQSPYGQPQSPYGQQPPAQSPYSQPGQSGQYGGQPGQYGQQSPYGQPGQPGQPGHPGQYGQQPGQFAQPGSYGQQAATQGEPPLWAPWYGIPFPKAFTRFWKKYVRFDGRASRSEFWFWALWWVIGNFATSIIDTVIGGGASGDSNVVGGLWALATFVGFIALTVRRLHDVNFSGLLALLFIIPPIGALFAIVIGCIPSVREGARFDQPERG